MQSKLMELFKEPPAIHVPAERAAIEILGSFFFSSATNFTRLTTSSASFGYTTSSGLISNKLASRLCVAIASAESSTSPFINDFIFSFMFYF